MKFKTKRSTLVGRQERLLKNPPATQKKAHRIIAKIATKIFGYKVEKERILRPYIIDSYIKDLYSENQVNDLFKHFNNQYSKLKNALSN